VRAAVAADRAGIEAFLRARVLDAMFPLSNLLRFGMDGGAGRATTFWVQDGAGGLAGVLGITGDGMVLPVCPDGDPRDMAAALAGRTVAGLMGTGPELRPLLDALGLGGARLALEEDEPQFALDLEDLVVPDGPGHLLPLARLEAGTRLAWRRDYCIELLGSPPEQAGETAARDIAAYLADDTHRVLCDGDTPLAMTGFNAVLPEIVQVGAVYTPPALRGLGHARRAVALHLAEARTTGVGQATLFASGPAAVRAYEALGFRRVGSWTMLLFADPEVTHA
jgi:GNAT superfamily N-acetyltransferase